jgi:ribonuclease HII
MNYDYEQKLIDKGYKVICGIDEAGRGPLAGPLVSSAVVLDSNNLELFSELKESKSLTEEKREEFFDLVKDNVLAWSVGMAHHFEIDKHGLAYANKIAMKRAWKYLNIEPDFIALDYMPGIHFKTDFELIKKGDAIVLTIAAASIIAKVIHDRIMRAFAEKYPNYCFRDHKGYGTKKHLKMIDMLGPSPIHRLTFGGVKKKLF